MTTETATDATIRIQREMSEDGTEVRLYCHSDKREEKENAMTKRFMERFEKGLAKLSENIGKPRGEKNIDKLSERIGRLKEKGHGIGQHYKIALIPDESGKKAISIVQQRVTATFRQRDGRTLHVRKATVAETELKKIYDALTISASPGGIKKLIV